jgi:hypothetical protein
MARDRIMGPRYQDQEPNTEVALPRKVAERRTLLCGHGRSQRTA